MEDTKQPKRVFIVGSARSGTTWLNLLLFQHPAVAAATETHVFSTYIKALNDTWNFHTASGGALPKLISRDDFDQMLRDLASSVFEKIKESKPGAQVAVEKTPVHVRYGESIHTIFPDAYFLHIVRDPRAVANSMIQASRSWAANWAPSNPTSAAQRWKRNVSAGREIASITPNYKEVRYEALISQGPEILQEIFAWLDLSGDRAYCEAIIEACRIDNIKEGRDTFQRLSGDSKKGSVGARKGTADSWKSEMSERKIRRIEAVAGDLMEELNYQRAFPGRTTKPLGLRAREWSEAAVVALFRWAVKRLPPSIMAAADKIGTEERGKQR